MCVVTLGVSVLTGPEKEDMAVCFPEHSSFHLSGEVYLKAEKEEITLKQGAIEMYFPLIRCKMFETYLEDVDEAVEQRVVFRSGMRSSNSPATWLRPSVYRIVRMLETVPVVWGTSYGRWENPSDILYLIT
jgi:hypothetical protein